MFSHETDLVSHETNLQLPLEIGRPCLFPHETDLISHETDLVSHETDLQPPPEVGRPCSFPHDTELVFS